MTQTAKQNRSVEIGIWAMAMGNFAAGMSSLVIAGVLTDIAADLGVSVGTAGQLVTIYTLVYGIGAPIVIALTSRFDRKLMLTVGMVLIFAGSFVAIFANSYALLFGARIIAAFGSAAFVPLAAAVAIAMVDEDQRGRATSIVFSGFSLSSALGLPIGAYIGLTFGWRFTFVAIVVIAIIGGLLVWTQLPKGIQTPPVSLAVFRKVFQHSLLMVVLSVTILQFGGQMALFAFIGPWLQAMTNLEAGGISIVLLITGIGGIVGTYGSGFGTDRIGARATQLISIIALVVIMIFLPIIQASLVIGVFMMFLWSGVGQGFIPPQLVRIANVGPELSTAALSLNSAFINVGLALGAFTGGLYIDNVGIETLSWFGVVGSMLALGIFGLSWVMESRANA
ncbi:MAG: MFS transporter [Chloroflexota bacterium]